MTERSRASLARAGAGRNVLTIYPGRDGTLLVHHAGPRAAEVRRVFGTVTIPSPYTGVAAMERAVRTISERNPDAEVRVSLVAPRDE